MTKENKRQKREDKFGLERVNFRKRTPEKSEIFSEEEARTYIDGCDYPESADDLLLAWEIKQKHPNLKEMSILDVMSGPGRLGRELLRLGAKSVTFHDGHETMLDHATKQARGAINQGQEIHEVLSQVDSMPIPDNTFDLVVSHNSTHQLGGVGKLRRTMRELLRVTKPGGTVMIADYQRGTSPEFRRHLEERLKATKPEIVPLLVPTFTAAFSKEEFSDAVKSQPDAENWSVTDANPPAMTRRMKQRVDQDPVKGHLMDFSPISQRVTVRKRRKK